MPVAFWCILAALILAYIPTGLAKAKKGSGFDNARPRQTVAQFTGFSERAYGAHQNGIEAFPFFAVAVITAHYMGGDAAMLDRLALAWIVLRLVYVGLYLKGLASLRSLAWGLALAVAIAIFTLPAWG